MNQLKIVNYNKIPLLVIILFAVSFYFFSPQAALAKIQKGSKRSDVISAYGEPTGVMTSGDEEILSYPGGMIVIKNGVVDKIDANFEIQLEQRSQEDNFKAKQDKKGLTQYKGEWIPKSQKTEIETKQKMQQKVLRISRNGNKVDLSELIVQGKITMVDFYADWCGPCKKLSPMLEELAHKNRDIYLRKIDIVNWGTPVANQYSIRSIPDVRVFDRNGRMVGRPTHNFNEIVAYLKQVR